MFKEKQYYVVTLFLFGCCLPGCQGKPNAMNGSESMSGDKLEDELVKLAVDLPDPLMLGEAWPLNVTLSNNSNETVRTMTRRGERSEVIVKVRDRDGTRVEPNEFGQRHLIGDLDVGTGRVIKVLEPSDTFTWPTIELDRCFDFTPGEYEVELAVVVEPVAMLRHEFKIEVLPPAK